MTRYALKNPQRNSVASTRLRKVIFLCFCGLLSLSGSTLSLEVDYAASSTSPANNLVLDQPTTQMLQTRLHAAVEKKYAQGTTCGALTDLDVYSQTVATYFDSVGLQNVVYGGDFQGNAIMKFAIDSTFTVSVDTLPLDYGVPMVACDLDLDGSLELVVQRGDGINGFLDIISTSTWLTRQRFVFPGMNVQMDPQAIDLVLGDYPEIIATPRTLGGASFVTIIEYDDVADSFAVTRQTTAPAGSYGRAVLYDFDNDGVIELAQGNWQGFGLYEIRPDSIVFISQIMTTEQPGQYLTSCSPFSDQVTHLLLGYSTESDGFVYWLMRPSGDNSFQLTETFQRQTGWHGASPCGAIDADCDGLDEIAMAFFPDFEVWGWNPLAGRFEQVCGWQGLGSMQKWLRLDLNFDGKCEWNFVNASGFLWSVESGGCLWCDANLHCATPAPCSCLCQSDPACDSVTDILDVIKTVDVAFRGAPILTDPSLTCPVLPTDNDCDGTTNVVDVVLSVNVAFRGAGLEDCASCQQTAVPISRQPGPPGL